MKWIVALAVACTAGIGAASAPVSKTATGCVLDGVFITTDGFLITVSGPKRLDLAPYAGKKIRVTGDLYPGDTLIPNAPIEVLGACSAPEKLAMLPVLARVYRSQADSDIAPASTKPAKRATAIDCADRTCYQVLRVPKAGGKAVVLRTAPLVGHIFVDKTNVYWSEGTGSSWDMMKLPKARPKDKPTSVAKGSLRGEMMRGPHGFYGVIDGGLVALEDSKPARILAPEASEVAIDATTLYYSDYGPENSGSFIAVPLAGGPSRILAASEPVPTTPFVANGELYWANINVPPLGGGEIMRVSVGGGVRTPVVGTLPKLTPWALTADARSVYWVEWGATGYEVYRAPRAGGDRTLLGLAPAKVMHRDNRDHIESDATHVYWNAREGVSRVAKSGGAVEELVRLARGDVMSFAIDNTDIYLAVVIF